MPNVERINFLAWGAGLAFCGVACGAFGAHALADRLDARMLEIWKTGVFYQLIHALALVALNERLPKKTGIAFILGTFLFSGSLYALALSGVRIFGAITPLGGVAFLCGWLILAFSARKQAR